MYSTLREGVYSLRSTTLPLWKRTPFCNAFFQAIVEPLFHHLIRFDSNTYCSRGTQVHKCWAEIQGETFSNGIFDLHVSVPNRNTFHPVIPQSQNLRIRRVKCDEEYTFYRRCQNFGAKCDGYPTQVRSYERSTTDVPVLLPKTLMRLSELFT